MTTTTNRALNDFVTAVRKAVARAPETHRFGRKVFLQAVSMLPLTEGVKQCLVEAHRAGLITLSRCDMPMLFPREMVEASEIAYLNATFHFVTVD